MNNPEPITIEALQKRIAQLEETIAGLEGTSKMLISRDVALRRAYEDLKSLDAQKSDFISIAAHQLRTPLTTVRWAHTMLLEGSGTMTDRQRDLLARSGASIAHMHQLVEDLLELNHIEYGNFSITKEVQSIEKLLEAVCTELLPHCTAKQITLTKNWSAESVPVAFDQKGLREVLVNIIENAIKYTPGGGAVVVATSYTDVDCTISVSDTGPGIPVDKQSSLFKKFSRLPEAKKVDPNGTGLGLYIAKRIMTLHNGTISIAPETSSGTTFIVTIPLK